MPEATDSARGEERSRPWRLTLSLRSIAATTVLLVALPIVLLLVWSVRVLQDAAREDTSAHARALTEIAAQQHRQHVADARTLLAVLAQLPDLIDPPSRCNVTLRRLLDAGRGYVNLGVIGRDGRVLCSALPVPAGTNLGDRTYFRHALEAKRFAAGSYQVGRITGAPGINFGYPILGSDGEVTAVVFAAISTHWLAQLVGSAQAPSGATAVLLDHQIGELVRYPAQASDEQAMPVAHATLAALIRQQPGAGDLPTAASGRRYTYVRLGGEQVRDAPYLVLGWPPDALVTSVMALTQRLPLLVLVTLLLLAALSWLALHAVVMQPVRRLAEAASRLAHGERGVRLPAGGRVTELAAMSGAFNHMAQRIDGAMRAYAVLSAGNRTLLHEQDEARLLEAMCRVAVQQGGYRYAWVAYVTDGDIRKMAEAGQDDGFADYLLANWHTALAHQTPTAQAVTSGQPVVLADARVAADHALFSAAAGRSLRSGLAMPLTVGHQVIGVFTIYAEQAAAFDEREQALLVEMAADLSFGIATARLAAGKQEAESRLHYLAYFDPVTGLPNEASFLEQTRAVCADGKELALLVVRLENYWEIAATLGQASGDVFLGEAAKRLDALAPTLLARVAQSEFALLWSDADVAAANRQADQALAALRPPAQLSGVGIDIAATIGIAVGGRRAGDAERLLQAAKLAAHDAGRRSQQVLLAHPELDREWRDGLTMAADLRAAIDARQLRVYAQPQLDLRTGAICCMEVLARWSREPGGEVSPARFIALAEKTGLIRPLTYAILDGVCELAEAHARVGLAIPIAVNISARNLHDPQFVGRLADLLERWPLPTECLHLELTETAVMQDPVHSLKVLQTLRGLGLSIYLDDFGTGYSSMAYLRELPLSGLKIDRGFIGGLAQPATHRIVQAMIELGHALDLKVVAEGVEDDATLEMLAGLGCDIAQGYGIARPMPGEEIAGWVARQPERRPVRTTDASSLSG
jgi:predicted signal transduction protein with EAL and GGDEF domain/HAMP domain-containing protein